MHRIVFIPGLGEDESIFENIQDRLPGEKLFLSFWDTLPNKHAPSLNAASFAKELIERFAITDNDLIIGHSTGGWVALHIKNIVDCTVVQIASWTDGKKVIAPVANRHVIYFAAKTGLYLNRLVLRHSLRKHYQDKPSANIFRTVFTKLITGNRANAVNQLRLVFNPYPLPLLARPDLVIHARGDRIVRFPDGAVHEVGGDHFSLYTHPEQVYLPIIKLLTNHGKE